MSNEREMGQIALKYLAGAVCSTLKEVILGGV